MTRIVTDYRGDLRSCREGLSKDLYKLAADVADANPIKCHEIAVALSKCAERAQNLSLGYCIAPMPLRDWERLDS